MRASIMGLPPAPNKSTRQSRTPRTRCRASPLRRHDRNEIVIGGGVLEVARREIPVDQLVDDRAYVVGPPVLIGFARRTANHRFESLPLDLGAGDEFVEGLDIGLVMLAVVGRDGLRRYDGGERVVGIGKRGELKWSGHEVVLSGS